MAESFEDFMQRKADRLNGVPKPAKIRKGLNKVSKKQKGRNVETKKAYDRHYADESNRQCAICGSADNLSVHHAEKRGGNSSKEETFITLCILGSAFNALFPKLNSNEGLGCHQGVERNKSWARENGYLK